MPDNSQIRSTMLLASPAANEIAYFLGHLVIGFSSGGNDNNA